MKILFFDDFKLGILKGDQVVDVSAVVADIPRLGPHDLINGLITHFEAYRPKIEAFVRDATGVPVASVRIRPPLPKPGHIDCMAVNYMEDGTRSEPAPINAFQKAPLQQLSLQLHALLLQLQCALLLLLQRPDALLLQF